MGTGEMYRCSSCRGRIHERDMVQSLLKRHRYTCKVCWNKRVSRHKKTLKGVTSRLYRYYKTQAKNVGADVAYTLSDFRELLDNMGMWDLYEKYKISKYEKKMAPALILSKKDDNRMGVDNLLTTGERISNTVANSVRYKKIICHSEIGSLKYKSIKDASKAFGVSEYFINKALLNGHKLAIDKHGKKILYTIHYDKQRNSNASK